MADPAVARVAASIRRARKARNAKPKAKRTYRRKRKVFGPKPKPKRRYYRRRRRYK